MSVFCDLQLPSHKTQVIHRAVELGYSYVGLNVDWYPAGEPLKRFRPVPNEHGNRKLPECPAQCPIDEAVVESFLPRPHHFTQLTRLTVNTPTVQAFVDFQGALSRKELDAFNLIAIRPFTEKLFTSALTSNGIDIICIDNQDDIPSFLRPEHIRTAIERNIFFEITYESTLRNSSVRMSVLCLVARLLNFTDGRNLLLSSGAEEPLDLRGPYDTFCTGLMLGLNPKLAKDTYSINATRCVAAAKRRRSFISVISLHKLSAIALTEAWKVKSEAERRKNALLEGEKASTPKESGSHSELNVGGAEKVVENTLSSSDEETDEEERAFESVLESRQLYFRYKNILRKTLPKDEPIKYHQPDTDSIPHQAPSTQLPIMGMAAPAFPPLYGATQGFEPLPYKNTQQQQQQTTPRPPVDDLAHPLARLPPSAPMPDLSEHMPKKNVTLPNFPLYPKQWDEEIVPPVAPVTDIAQFFSKKPILPPVPPKPPLPLFMAKKSIPQEMNYRQDNSWMNETNDDDDDEGIKILLDTNCDSDTPEDRRRREINLMNGSLYYSDRNRVSLEKPVKPKNPEDLRYSLGIPEYNWNTKQRSVSIDFDTSIPVEVKEESKPTGRSLSELLKTAKEERAIRDSPPQLPEDLGVIAISSPDEEQLVSDSRSSSIKHRRSDKSAKRKKRKRKKSESSVEDKYDELIMSSPESHKVIRPELVDYEKKIKREKVIFEVDQLRKAVEKKLKARKKMKGAKQLKNQNPPPTVSKQNGSEEDGEVKSEEDDDIIVY